MTSETKNQEANKSAATKENVVKPSPAKEESKSGKIVKGDLVRSKMGDTADAITCQPYPADAWTEVEKPSDWLDAQFAAGKFERK